MRPTVTMTMTAMPFAAIADHDHNYKVATGSTWLQGTVLFILSELSPLSDILTLFVSTTA